MKVRQCTAVWKFGNCPATQILREINFCWSGFPKYAIFTVSGPLKFCYSEFLHFDRAEIDKKSKFRASRIV